MPITNESRPPSSHTLETRRKVGPRGLGRTSARRPPRTCQRSQDSSHQKSWIDNKTPPRHALPPTGGSEEVERGMPMPSRVSSCCNSTVLLLITRLERGYSTYLQKTPGEDYVNIVRVPRLHTAARNVTLQPALKAGASCHRIIDAVHFEVNAEGHASASDRPVYGAGLHLKRLRSRRRDILRT